LWGKDVRAELPVYRRWGLWGVLDNLNMDPHLASKFGSTYFKQLVPVGNIEEQQTYSLLSRVKMKVSLRRSPITTTNCSKSSALKEVGPTSPRKTDPTID